MAVHREPSLAEYWSRGHKNAPTHKLNDFMGCRGPINLPTFTNADAQAFTPTESVPVALVLAVNADGQRLFPSGLHIVWDDNLFNTIPMLKYLRRQGVGCAGTVQTTKTTTKETFKDAARVELQAKDVSVKGRARQKVAKERFSSSLIRLKTQFTKHIDGEVLQAAWRDNQVVLFASTVAE
ncbi:hypothetical protein BU23DRAFT_561064, partial [Bimuria novae-zelandiae CBS 107.79]